MFDLSIHWAIHIIPFLSIMGQVVTIWGFLNFANQLNLQNLTFVADRALGRLPSLKAEIFILKNCEESDIRETLNRLNQIVKRLYIDLKQLDIANRYDMKRRIILLSQQGDDLLAIQKNYLMYELGLDWQKPVRASFNLRVPFIENIETQLLEIFDLSHTGNAFMNHLSTNVIRVSWFSLVMYLVECNQVTLAGYLFIAGIVAYFAIYFYDKR